MTNIVLPNLNQTGKNEWADVQGNDEAIKKVVNGELDNGNIKAAAGIVGTKLADGAVESRQFKPTVGIKTASGNLAASGAYTLIPNCKLEITPAIASKLKITAIADITCRVDGAGNDNTAIADIALDGVQQGPGIIHEASGAANMVSRATVSQVYLLTLTAAKHTIELKGRNEGFGESTFGGASGFTYELVAS